MKNHPYSVALSKPTSTQLLRPGSVGYWNRLGDWKLIAQLDDPESLEKRGLKAPEEKLERAKHKVITDWGRKYSTLVEETNVPANCGTSVCSNWQRPSLIYHRDIPGAPAS